MPSDLLTVRLDAASPTSAPRTPIRLAPLSPTWREPLAHAYLTSYPPGVAATNATEAQQEIDDTFAGAFGVLRIDASWIALDADRLVGCIIVTERSIWDADLDGPFAIELFVLPEARGRGVGRILVQAAMASCVAAGDQTLSLRVGEGTSPAAHALYRSLGFRPAQ